MRNQFSGQCYVCLKTVPPGQGDTERHAKFVPVIGVTRWRVRHFGCFEVEGDRPHVRTTINRGKGVKKKRNIFKRRRHF